jgi:hypothetical protein
MHQLIEATQRVFGPRRHRTFRPVLGAGGQGQFNHHAPEKGGRRFGIQDPGCPAPDISWRIHRTIFPEHR